MTNLISSSLKKFIESQALGLATVNKSGRPHNIAVAGVKVVNGQIIISNLHIKESVKNLEYNNKISLVVWNKEWEKSCVGFELVGTAKNYNNGKWLKYVQKLSDNEGCIVYSALVVKVKKIKRLLS